MKKKKKEGKKESTIHTHRIHKPDKKGKQKQEKSNHTELKCILTHTHTHTKPMK